MQKETVIQATLVAKQMVDNGQPAIARDGTVLKTLVDSLRPISIEAGDKTTMATVVHSDNAGRTMYQTEEDFTNSLPGMSGPESAFNMAAQSAADDIAPFIVSHLSIARNTIVPLVNEAEEALQYFLTNAKAMPAEQNFKITVGALPDLLRDEAFLSANVAAFKDSQASDEIFSRLGLSDMLAVDTIVSGAMNLGNERLNGLVAKWVDEAQFDIIKRCLLVNFYDQGAIGDLGKADTDRLGQPVKVDTSYYLYDDYGYDAGRGYRNSFAELNIALAMNLLASWLSDNPQKCSRSLETYKEIVESIKAESAIKIITTLRRVNLQLETGTLVCEYNPIYKEVTVINPTYSAWLENGGSPEVLFGFLVNNQQYFDVKICTEQREEGLKAWATYVAYNNSIAERQGFETFKSFLRSYMRTSMTNLTEIEQEYLKDKSEMPHRDKVTELIDAEIAHFDHRLLENIPHLALHLVAKARFFFTSSYAILSEMAKIGTDNPSIDPREAASMAMIRYIADFLADQTAVAHA